MASQVIPKLDLTKLHKSKKPAAGGVNISKILQDCTANCLNGKDINELVDDNGQVMTVELEDSDDLLKDIANQSMIEAADFLAQSSEEDFEATEIPVR